MVSFGPKLIEGELLCFFLKKVLEAASFSSSQGDCGPYKGLSERTCQVDVAE